MNFAAQEISGSNLPSRQGFQIDGATTVRGCNEELVNGDKGVFINLEIHRSISTPILYADPNKLLSLLLFADRGYSQLHKSSAYEEESNLLACIGVGVQFNYARNLNASVVMGIPLISDEKLDDAWRAHLNPVYRFYYVYQ